MKYSKRISENDSKNKKDGLLDRADKGKKKRDDKPSEEYISPDPSRSNPEKNSESEPDKMDQMGISKKAKNQPSDESDIAKNKK